MSNIEDVKAKYLKDADSMGSKSRFGYFSIPPPAGTGQTLFKQKKAKIDQNGRVITEQRNIFSGPTASGVLKKNFFEYTKSVFQGDPFTDPGKFERLEQLEKSKKLLGQEIYKPLSLAKTPPPKASYQHIPEKPVKKMVKDCIDQNGKVITQERNITANMHSTIEKERRKQLKYVSDPYENHIIEQRKQNKQSISKRGEVSFRSSSPVKQFFAKNKEIFGEENCNLSKTARAQTPRKIQQAQNDGPFKPSCARKFDTFSYPEYIPGGNKPIKKGNMSSRAQKQAYKLTKQPNNFKPSPSITTMKTNMMRKIR